MAQRGEVKISQENPESFGEISITLLSRWFLYFAEIFINLINMNCNVININLS